MHWAEEAQIRSNCEPDLDGASPGATSLRESLCQSVRQYSVVDFSVSEQRLGFSVSVFRFLRRPHFSLSNQNPKPLSLAAWSGLTW